VSDLLFAYGTLLPGQSRWHHLQPLVVDEGVAVAVGGSLYDTGHGYPAAVFSHPGTIRGRVFRLQPDRVDQALQTIDEVERTADQHYRRVRIQTDEYPSVWAYEYVGHEAMTPIAGGSWAEHVGASQPRRS
jgi:gamma-glutamylcyclotransferase (GGCT)/AIG2-like uncharacterized protein YtfP